ncbi:hypothetical protein EVAR_36050_1 [Eumeta japonica]|uniref:Uncharacterized protein n=1 Tax=Eumeta variegata TaxID=151549 RepID=A0A4C1WS62_EUMVA|nr:hypothetical protein EVAR_36050_1 [Eumeta japonica]
MTPLSLSTPVATELERFVVERQIRGSAVGCMLHVGACCGQAPPMASPPVPDVPVAAARRRPLLSSRRSVAPPLAVLPVLGMPAVAAYCSETHNEEQ